MTGAEPFVLDLAGLTAAPAQTWGAVRLVPLLRDEPIDDLRLHPVPAAAAGAERYARRETDPANPYVTFVPHAFVAAWAPDEPPAAAYGTQLGESKPTTARLRFRLRSMPRKAGHPLRFLPQQLALEGYLSLYLGWERDSWELWTQESVARGLSPWVETTYTGGRLVGLADALRIFEIHPRQCGVVLYTGDRLAAAYVLPHPADYRALHPTLLLHLYGEQLHHYATAFPEVPDLIAPVDDAGVRTPEELRARLAEAVDTWRRLHTVMIDGLVGAAQRAELVRRLGRFTLLRFRPDLDLRAENHLGEAIVDDAGRPAYLATFRLSDSQTRRAHLLSRWTACRWDLDDTAADLGIDPVALIDRLDRAGFGHLLRPDVRAQARDRRRRRRHS